MKKLLLLILPVLLFTSCANGETSNDLESGDTKLHIVTTISPLYSFTKNIVGDDAEVTNLVPPGATVHTWEPNAMDLRKIAEADVLIKNGLGLEEFVSDMVEASGNTDLVIVDTSERVEVLPFLAVDVEGGADHGGEEHHEGDDPHIWLSIERALRQVSTIEQALLPLDKEHTEVFKNNAAAYRNTLRGLKEEIQETMNGLEKKNFIVFHNAYQYFLGEFTLLGYMKGVIEEFPGKEPSLMYLKDITSLIEKENIQVIFTEPQFSPKLVTTLQQDYDIRSFEIDPLGAEVSKEGYEHNMRALLEQFREAFSQ